MAPENNFWIAQGIQVDLWRGQGGRGAVKGRSLYIDIVAIPCGMVPHRTCTSGRRCACTTPPVVGLIKGRSTRSSSRIARPTGINGGILIKIARTRSKGGVKVFGIGGGNYATGRAATNGSHPIGLKRRRTDIAHIKVIGVGGIKASHRKGIGVCRNRGPCPLSEANRAIFNLPGRCSARSPSQREAIGCSTASTQGTRHRTGRTGDASTKVHPRRNGRIVIMGIGRVAIRVNQIPTALIGPVAVDKELHVDRIPITYGYHGGAIKASSKRIERAHCPNRQL